jgi:Uma2 family endonuclease
MTVMTREPEAQPDEPQPDSVLREFLSLEIPDGYRAQLIDGEIIVTPPPGGNHEHCISQIMRQVFTRSASPMDVSGHKGLIVPSIVEGQNHVIPDLTIAPAELSLFVDAPSWMRPSGVVMVVEVTSTLADHDRNPKRRSYAAARIPLYLPVGQDDKTVTLFSGPSRDAYVNTATVPFGDPLDLPEPFSFTLETADFVA